IYYSTGSGVIQSANIPLGLYQVMAAADFNGDGMADLLLCPDWRNGGTGLCVTYYSTGTGLSLGNFTPDWTFNATYAADFNGDGYTDLLSCPLSPAQGGNGGACQLFYSTGPSFTQGSSSLELSGWAVSLLDFNGDGKIDVIGCPPDEKLL